MSSQFLQNDEPQISRQRSDVRNGLWEALLTG